MFGKGTEKKGPPTIEFDLEKDLRSDPGKVRALKEQLAARIQELKTLMRKGEDQKTFDDAQTLLHAYLAAQKVVGRINRKLG